MPKQGGIDPPLNDSQLMKREYENGELTGKSNIEGLFGCTKGKQRSRLSGGGRKPLCAKMEELLLEWIENRRALGLRVSCKLIMKKAKVTYRDMTENTLGPVQAPNFS